MSCFDVRASVLLPGHAWDGQGTQATATVQGGAAAPPSLHLSTGGETGGCSVSLEQQSVWKAGPRLLMVRVADAAALPQWLAPAKQEPDGSSDPVPLIALSCSSAQAAGDLATACERAAEQTGGSGSGGGVLASPSSSNVFDAKIDKASSAMYFHYYGMLQHQQNMLQDATRTGTYHSSILGNRPDFEGKEVMDVGAGSGILSLFAAQAGAAKVYAVEASGMARFAAQLARANPPFGNVIEVLHSKVEELKLPEGKRVDVLVSEPMGTLLVNERMLETYIYARDHFLKPGGKMFPQVGRIHAAAFTDPLLYSEVAQKAAFWQQPAFYGVDVTGLFEAAAEGYFSQVVVDAFDPSLLVSGCATRVFDFLTISETELYNIEVPLALTVGAPTTVHGIATWFDVLFNGSAVQRWLSTAPGLPTTHWFQLRCVLAQPVVVLQPHTVLKGTLRLTAHERQSYEVTVNLTGPPLQPGGPPQQSSGQYDLKEPYYRQLTNWYAYQQQQQQPPPPQQSSQMQLNVQALQQQVQHAQHPQQYYHQQQQQPAHPYHQQQGYPQQQQQQQQQQLPPHQQQHWRHQHSE